MFRISRTSGDPWQYCQRAMLAWLALSAVLLHAAEPKKVALLVGVNKYIKAGLRNLDFPEADVEAVGAELKKLGFQVAILKGSSTGNKQATRENIEAAARAIVKPLGKDDLMLVMLSGHGMQLEVIDADKKKRDDGFYCPVDAVTNDPTTLYSLSHLTDEILAPNVGKKLVLIDACRDVPKDPDRSAKGIQGKVISLPEDTAVLFGCRSGQQSYEDEKLGHGLFTHCLLEGLRGKAAKEGRLTWSGLAAYVEDRLSADDMKAKMPKDRLQEAIAAGGVGQLVLAKAGPKPTSTSETPNLDSNVKLDKPAKTELPLVGPPRSVRISGVNRTTIAYCDGIGKEIWKNQMPDSIDGAEQDPLSDSVFSLLHDGAVSSLDGSTGKVLWRNQIPANFRGKEFQSFNFPKDNVVTLQFKTGGSVSFDRRTGQLLK